MLDFGFASADEICRELASRLRTARMEQGLQQVELASRAGVSRGTVITLEKSGHCTFESLVRIAMALDLVDQLTPLFVFKVRSIADMEKRNAPVRKRVRKTKPGATP